MPSTTAQAGAGAGGAAPAGLVLDGVSTAASFASGPLPTVLILDNAGGNEAQSYGSSSSTESQTSSSSSTLSLASSSANSTTSQPPPTSAPAQLASESRSGKSGGNHQTAIIAAVVASAAVLLALALILFRHRQKRRRLQRLADLTYKPAPRVASFVAPAAGDTRLSSQMSLIAPGMQGSSVISTNAYTHDEVPLSGRFRSLSISSSHSAGTYRAAHRPLPPPAVTPAAQDEVVHITMPAAQPPRGSPLGTGGWGGAEEQDVWDPASPLQQRSASPDAPRASNDTGHARPSRKRPPRLSTSTPANNPSAWATNGSDNGQVRD